MASQAKSKPKREMVQHPLTPSSLSAMGALETSPLPAGPFDRAGPWTHTYRIWTCYGYRGSSNRDQGKLSIRRAPSPDRKHVDLAVEQVVWMDPKKEQDAHHLAARIRCRADGLASPISWTLSSRFTRGPDKKPLPELDHDEKTVLSEGLLEVRTGGRSFPRQVSERFTSDWSLFDALQRLSAGDEDVISFDLLEGLTAWKPGQRLSHRGKFPVAWGGETVELDCFQQLGVGVWPYEYWLDPQHRLLAAITGARVFIWEPTEGGAK
jgi:hypothetical protein